MFNIVACLELKADLYSKKTESPNKIEMSFDVDQKSEIEKDPKWLKPHKISKIDEERSSSKSNWRTIPKILILQETPNISRKWKYWKTFTKKKRQTIKSKVYHTFLIQVIRKNSKYCFWIWQKLKYDKINVNSLKPIHNIDLQ